MLFIFVICVFSFRCWAIRKVYCLNPIWPSSSTVWPILLLSRSLWDPTPLPNEEVTLSLSVPLLSVSLLISQIIYWIFMSNTFKYFFRQKQKCFLWGLSFLRWNISHVSAYVCVCNSDHQSCGFWADFSLDESLIIY